MTSHQETEKNGCDPQIFVGVAGRRPTQDEDGHHEMTPAGRGSNQGMEGSDQPFGIAGSSSKGTCEGRGRVHVKGEEGYM